MISSLKYIPTERARGYLKLFQRHLPKIAAIFSKINK